MACKEGDALLAAVRKAMKEHMAFEGAKAFQTLEDAVLVYIGHRPPGRGVDEERS